MLIEAFLGLAKPAIEAVGVIFRKFRGRRGALTAEETVAQKYKWKPIIEQWLFECRRDGIGRDVTVRDVKRLDKYPETDENDRGISPWFRSGLVGTYDGGILLLLRWVTLRKEALAHLKLPHFERSSAFPEGKFALIARVAYAQIVEFDQHGDDYSSRASLYLHFDGRREGPYDKFLICKKNVNDEPPPGVEWWTEICDADDYELACAKEGIKDWC
jgi:hypothetical protein